MPSRTPAPDPAADEPARDPQQGSGLPAVVAVVVTAGGPDSVEPALRGLAAQEYGNLTVVVLDAASPVDPTARIAELLPEAFVRRLGAGPTFGAVANDVLGTVEGATFLLFCHDDAELAPGAVQALVTEAFRANAGIVGAKVVRADDPEVLAEMGYGVDAFAQAVPVVEPGELDQAQHDVAREVFMVSTVAMLVRADLFVDLGGFGRDLTPHGEALDLCWRARIAGAQVAVQPAAVVRHAGRSSIADPDALQRRHEVRDQGRIVLTGYSGVGLLRTAPLAALLSTLDLIASLVTGHLQRAGDVVGAWWWNARRLPSVLGVRRRNAAIRRASDRELRSAQLRGSARLVVSARALRSATSRRVPEAIAAARGLPGNLQEAATLPGIGVAVVVASLLLIGSRGLLSDGIPVLRDFLSFRGGGGAAGEWWRGWRTTGFGHRGGAPGLLPLLGVGHLVLFGHDGLLRTVALLAALPIGVLGAWRWGRGALSPRSRVVITLAYLFVPVPYDAMVEGRWVALVAYGCAPWILGRFARASGLAPFGSAQPRHDGLVLGLLLAAAAAVSPSVLVLAAALAAVMALALVAGRHREAALNVGRAAGVAIGIGLVGSLPAVLDLLGRSDRWDVLWGPSSARRPRLDELLRLSAGLDADMLLWYAVPVVATLAVLVGRGWRFRWAAVGWLVAITAWAGALLVHRWWSGGAHPPLGWFLAPAAAGLACAVGLGLESFRSDVAGGAFGWRQAAASAVGLVAAVAVVPFLVVAADGRWNLPDSGVVEAMSTLDSSSTSFRTLWLGDPDDLPMRSTRLRDGLDLAVTTGVVPTATWIHPGRAGSGDREVARRLRDALDGGDARLGAGLARSGIRYVALVADAGPRGVVGARVAAMRDVLAQQLDLHRIDVMTGMDVYEVADGRATAVPAREHPVSGLNLALVGVQVIGLAAAIRAAIGGRTARRRRRDEAGDDRSGDGEPTDRAPDEVAT